MSRSITRCINLDWLEVYCLEDSIGYPHNADFFRDAGWHVVEREYGTPIYHEMFKLYGTDNLPFIEVRRRPKSAIGQQVGGVLDPYSCHIRLCNRTCYMEDAAGIMQHFLEQYGFGMSRISRLDLCLDFEYFDHGDNPQVVLDRYVRRKYSKINQSKMALHGLDNWDGRYWNSAKWGSPHSMVTTKFYDKTLELREQSDKPYIRQAWFSAGLITDWHTCEKVREDGTVYKPKIWRVEFSIKSSEKNWFVVEDPYGRKPKLRSIRHTLDQYHTRSQMCDVFFSLASHYFHFKKVVMIEADGEQKLQRKDRCPDKVLFDPEVQSVYYKLARIATSEKKYRPDHRLLKYLYEYRETVHRPELYKACNVLIEQLESTTRLHDVPFALDADELTVLRQLISRRIKSHDLPLSEEKAVIEAMLSFEDKLFGERPAAGA